MPCFRRVFLINRVSAPVAGDDVHETIVIKVTDRDTIPRTDPLRESEVCSNFGESAVSKCINSDRPPLAGEKQFRNAVSVEIAPSCGAHEADVFERSA